MRLDTAADYDALVARMDRDRLTRDTTIAALPRTPHAFRCRWGGQVILVCREPGQEGGWRASRFDEHGAAGHTTRADFASAVLASAIEVAPDTVDDVVAALGVVVAFDAV